MKITGETYCGYFVSYLKIINKYYKNTPITTNKFFIKY
jgi:hypothetical protein